MNNTKLKLLLFITLIVFIFESVQAQGLLRCFGKSRRNCLDKTAVIIVDMQSYFTTQQGAPESRSNKSKVRDVLTKQVALIEWAKARSLPVIIIEYEDIGPTFPILTNALSGYSNNRHFLKSRAGIFNDYDPFSKSLSRFLRTEGIDNIIIAGANGGDCVQESIINSLEKNYDIIAYTNGIADFNYDSFKYPYRGFYNGNNGKQPTFMKRALENCDGCSLTEVDELFNLDRALQLL